MRLEKYGVFAVFQIGEVASVISDKDTVSKVVSGYVSSGSPSYSSNLSRIYDLLVYTRDLKYKSEYECSALTGTDRFSCHDRESCRYSCFSVQICSLVGQSGWDFLDNILDYKIKINKTNSLFEDAITSSVPFYERPSYENAEKILYDIQALNRAQTQIINHPLITSYGFCPPHDYGLPYQLEGRKIILDYLDAYCLYGEKESIINQSLHVASKLTLQPAPKIIIAQNSNSSFNEVNMTNVTLVVIGYETGSCCFAGICSVAGIEKIEGVCWEWWMLGVVVLLIFMCISVPSLIHFLKRKLPKKQWKKWQKKKATGS